MFICIYASSSSFVALYLDATGLKVENVRKCHSCRPVANYINVIYINLLVLGDVKLSEH
jgi:hypothetical protein